MKLHARERARLDDRGVAFAARDDCVGLARIRVREPVRLIAGVDRGPADARHAALAEPDSAAGDEPEPGRAAVLFALVERDLRTEADAEYGPPRGDTLAQHVGRG